MADYAVVFTNEFADYVVVMAKTKCRSIPSTIFALLLQLHPFRNVD